MSNDLVYVKVDDVAESVRNGERGLVVVDVREPTEFSEGHVSGALNYPSSEWLNEEFLRIVTDELSDMSTVVFHCAKSQQRGPNSARAFSSFLERYHAGRGQDSTLPAIKVMEGGYNEFATRFAGDDALIEKHSQHQ